MSRLALSALISAAAGLGYRSVADLCGPSRGRALVRLRWAVAINAQDMGYSYAQIGRVMGGRDHSTIIYACQRADYFMGRDAKFARLVIDVRRVAERMQSAEREAISRAAEGLAA